MRPQGGCEQYIGHPRIFGLGIILLPPPYKPIDASKYKTFLKSLLKNMLICILYITSGLKGVNDICFGVDRAFYTLVLNIIVCTELYTPIVISFFYIVYKEKSTCI